MARGIKAKEYVIKKLKEVFGDDYIGEVDKKFYVWSYEDGQKTQVSIALTCPKNPVGEIPEFKEDFDWSQSSTSTASSYKPAEITDDEKQKVADLMARLGL